MKTTADLNALIPQLIDRVLDGPAIGDSFRDWDGDSYCTGYNYEDNCVCYEEDGWFIEISYRCAGDWCEDGDGYYTPRSSYCGRAHGEVEDIVATYCDPETEDEIEFTDDDLDEMYDQINKALENF